MRKYKEYAVPAALRNYLILMRKQDCRYAPVRFGYDPDRIRVSKAVKPRYPVRAQQPFIMIGRIVILAFILFAQIAPIPAPVPQQAMHAEIPKTVGLVHFGFDPVGCDQLSKPDLVFPVQGYLLLSSFRAPPKTAYSIRGLVLDAKKYNRFFKC